MIQYKVKALINSNSVSYHAPDFKREYCLKSNNISKVESKLKRYLDKTKYNFVKIISIEEFDKMTIID